MHYLITERKLAFASCNQKLAGIRFFYKHVLGRGDFDLRVPAKRSGRLPEPLGRGEITRLIEAVANRKHRVLLMTCYAAGLRVSELVHLKPQDIHSERMLIRVDQGKGRKDRYTLLSPRLLEELRDYWREYRPRDWLFANQAGIGSLHPTSAQKIYYAAKERARIEHGHGIHLFPVHGLSKMFRGKFLDGLAKLLDGNALDLPPQLGWLGDADGPGAPGLRRWLPAPWVVYSKPPLAGPNKLVEYLGRYTHRVAISNQRLLSCDDGEVRFRYRDRRDGDRVKIATLPATEFISRFLLHVLPARFLRVRHYGFLANRAKQKALTRCRTLLGVAPPADHDDRPRTLADWLRTILGTDPTCCPHCGDRLHRQTLPRIVTRPGALSTTASPGHPNHPVPWDSS